MLSNRTNLLPLHTGPLPITLLPITPLLMAAVIALASSHAASPHVGATLAPAPAPAPAAASSQVVAVSNMIDRQLGPGSSAKFLLDLVAPMGATGYHARAQEHPEAFFALAPATTPGGPLVAHISGTSGVELAAGVGHYLRHIANISFSWPGTGGNNIAKAGAAGQGLPALLARDAGTHHRQTRWSYSWNVCTNSYSFVWWNFTRWQQEIDLMALFGVNLPLAYVGQEYVLRATLKQPPYSLTDADFAPFFAGPAWLTWQRSQGLRGWGGPLPINWITDHMVLQKKILAAMRGFGMKPVLAGFQGFVPVALMHKFPRANITRVGKPPLCADGTLGDKYGCPAVIDAVDPFFQQVASDYMRVLIRTYDTDHFYGADGFFSNVHSPWMEPAPSASQPHQTHQIQQAQQTHQVPQVPQAYHGQGSHHVQHAPSQHAPHAQPAQHPHPSPHTQQETQTPQLRESLQTYQAPTTHVDAPLGPERLFDVPLSWWADHAAAAYAGMAVVDPAAVWVYQTYPWHQFIYRSRDANNAHTFNQTLCIVKAWVSAVKKGSLLLLDLWADAGPLWKLTDSFFDTPFIWCMLHSFGGNNGMWGDLKTISTQPQIAAAASRSMVGVGITAEGINQNWVVYELMLEASFRPAAMTEEDLWDWLMRYQSRRYGMAAAVLSEGKSVGEVDAWTRAKLHAAEAWQVLGRTVYNLTCALPDAVAPHNTTTCMAQHEPGLGFHSVNRQPTLSYGQIQHWYNVGDLAGAWRSITDAAGAAPGDLPSPLLHDLIDVGREAMAHASDAVSNQIKAAATRGNAQATEGQLAVMYNLIVDLDRLVACAGGMLLGTWLESAKGWGHTAAETALYEWNARQQITAWSFHYPGKLPGTGDYAAKMWAGLLQGYYLQRWRLYGSMLAEALRGGTVFNSTAYAIAEDNMTDTWVHGSDVYPAAPSKEDPVALSRELFAKYAYLLQPAPPPPPPPGPAPSKCNTTTPTGYTRQPVGGYWKAHIHSGGDASGTIQGCAEACTGTAGCLAFEVANPCSDGHCYIFNGTAGVFIRNPACFTYVRVGE